MAFTPNTSAGPDGATTPNTGAGNPATVTIPYEIWQDVRSELRRAPYDRVADLLQELRDAGIPA